MSREGWSYWSDSELVHESRDGSRVFAKDGYECHCPPGTWPGDADTGVCKAGLWPWPDDDHHHPEPTAKARYSVLEDVYECPSCGAEPYTYACGAAECRCSVCGWSGEYDRGPAVEVDLPGLPQFAIRELESRRRLSPAAMAAVQVAAGQRV